MSKTLYTMTPHDQLSAEELGRFVVITYKRDPIGWVYELTFFDKQRQSDFIGQTSVRKGPAALALIGTHVCAWQEEGAMLC